MTTKPDKMRPSEKKQQIAKGLALAVIAGSVLAAATFVPGNQPWGYIAPPVLSSSRLKTGNVVAYTPWFEAATHRGDLLALPVNQTGTVAFLAPLWRGSDTLDNQNYDTGRIIATVDDSGTPVPFRYDELSPGQQGALDADPATAEALLDYVRGNRALEGAGWRTRRSVLGSIVHANPVYVGKPGKGYIVDDYPDFALANLNRTPHVYVGANDGMLHAFNAATGEESFAYVPSMVIPNLYKLARTTFDHEYFVDGFLTQEDAMLSNGDWASVLVGGLGAGGMGYFALDVTSPSANDENRAAQKVLWEFTTSSTGAENLGYSYGRPSIVRIDNSGGWGVILSNGYMSTTGAASLYVLDVETGAVIKELVVPDADRNGLSSPTVIDSDSDGIADVAYAGDLNGNLWKFQLGPDGPDSWGVALSGAPLYRAGTSRPITTAPDVGAHPKEVGVMVYFGTGQLFSSLDGFDTSTQAVYGIWDTGAAVGSTELVSQTLKSGFHTSGLATRTITNNPVDWASKKGWVVQTQVDGASTLDKGERVLQDVTLRDGRLSVVTVNPTIPTGENWYIQLDAYTGGAPDATILDINEDLQLTVADNVDADGDGQIEDIPTERAVGQYQKFGLASKPVFGVIDSNNDAALINHLTAVSPNIVITADDPGLLGGHFDLDTSSEIYGFGNGDTDGHVHEWDDKWERTTIDFLDLPDTDKLFNIDDNGNGVGPNDIFIITVANTHLSPGGELEINSSSVGVEDYRRLQDRYLTGKLRGFENFPRFKINEPTAAEAAAGVVQLDSLKMSFSAYTLVVGGLMPTQTGCVRGNDQGALGEYRNGALLVQAVNADNLAGGITYDAVQDEYEIGASGSSVDAEFGHAKSGLLWESSMFWHWDNDCYGEGNWELEYAVCIVGGDGSCLEGISADEQDAAEKTKDKDKETTTTDTTTDGGTDTGTTPAPTEDPGHNVTNTTTAGGANAGRLFWRELIPQE